MAVERSLISWTQTPPRLQWISGGDKTTGTMMAGQGKTSEIRLAEIVAALSLATDLGTGQSFEFALQSCILAMRRA
ncbi:MAG: hypothetical protein ABI947_18480 [Chloroflexota bacterium]